MLITEELHLLLTEADGRSTFASASTRAYGAVAALIVDLMLAGRVTVTDERAPVVHIVSGEATGDPILDVGLAALRRHDGRSLSAVVQNAKLDPGDEVVASLVQRGVLTVGERGFFGLGALRTPEKDGEPERLLRARLTAVLDGSRRPSVADATLLSVLHALEVAHRVLVTESGGLGRAALCRRITEVVDRTQAADAVAKAVRSLNMIMLTAAVMPAIMVATS